MRENGSGGASAEGIKALPSPVLSLCRSVHLRHQVQHSGPENLPCRSRLFIEALKCTLGKYKVLNIFSASLCYDLQLMTLGSVTHVKQNDETTLLQSRIKV